MNDTQIVINLSYSVVHIEQFGNNFSTSVFTNKSGISEVLYSFTCNSMKNLINILMANCILEDKDIGTFKNYFKEERCSCNNECEKDYQK